MASLQSSPSIHRTSFLNSLPQVGSLKLGTFPCSSRRGFTFLVRADNVSVPSATDSQDKCRRRHVLTAGAIASWVPFNQPLTSLPLKARLLIVQCFDSFDNAGCYPKCPPWYGSVAAETTKGFLPVLDKKDGYSFLYPFGWQVAEALIKRVLAPPSQKTKLIEATEHDVDGTAYYTFEFLAQAPNYTRHALSAICIGNGKFYALTTGANERRWGKMKDRLHTVIDSFKIFNV